MLLFRSLTLGLVGAVFWMQLDTERLPAPAPPPPVVAQSEGPTIIDVAPGISDASLTGLVRMKPGEHVVSVDDRDVASDLEAGAAISVHQQPYVDGAGSAGAEGQRSWIDVEVRTESGGSRRVLLLLH